MKSYSRRKVGLLTEKWEALRTEFIVPARVVANRSNFHRNLIFTYPSTKLVSIFLFNTPFICYEFLKFDPRKKLCWLCCSKSAVSQKLNGKSKFWDIILYLKGTPTSLDILLYFFSIRAVDYENCNQSFVSRFWLSNERSKVLNFPPFSKWSSPSWISNHVTWLMTSIRGRSLSKQDE